MQCIPVYFKYTIKPKFSPEMISKLAPKHIDVPCPAVSAQ